MKISTKTGDFGDTGLFGGRRVRKGSGIIEVLGSLDELQSFLGLAKFGGEMDGGSVSLLERVQDDVYRMQAVVGFEMKVPEGIGAICEEDLIFLEDEIVKLEREIGEIKNFVRPGGTESAARLHVARTVCRRAERVFVRICDEFSGSEMFTHILKYLNRLSDLLFLLAYRDESGKIRRK